MERYNFGLCFGLMGTIFRDNVVQLWSLRQRTRLLAVSLGDSRTYCCVGKKLFNVQERVIGFRETRRGHGQLRQIIPTGPGGESSSAAESAARPKVLREDLSRGKRSREGGPEVSGLLP